MAGSNFQENCFRVLGLQSNVSLTRARNRVQLLRTRARFGETTATGDPLSFLGVLHRSEESIRDAMNRFQSPPTRILDRFFWFYVTGPSDEDALHDLELGHSDKVISVWEKNNDTIPQANLARLLYALCVEQDKECTNPQLWTRSLTIWERLIDDDRFWSHLQSLEEVSGMEPQASSDDWNNLRMNAWVHTLSVQTELAKEAVTSSNDDIAIRYLGIIHDSKIPESVYPWVEGRVLDSLGQGILEAHASILTSLKEMIPEVEESDSKTDEERSRVRKGCDEAYRQFENEIQPRLNRMLNIASSESETSRRIQGVVVECLRAICLAYHNDADDFDRAWEIMEKHAQVAAGTYLENRINEELKLLDQHSQAKPIKKAPAMRTLNGIGTKLYGCSDRDASTGRYISTLYFVILYIPVFPIARYKVSDEGGNMYRFYGKARLRTMDKIHRWAFIGLVVIWIINSLNSSDRESRFGNSRSYPQNHSTQAPYEQTVLDSLQEYKELATIEANRELEVLDSLKIKLNRYKFLIDSLARRIDNAEQLVRLGMVDTSEYESYTREVKLYNKYIHLRSITLHRYKAVDAARDSLKTLISDLEAEHSRFGQE